jgi:hypothetical protein
MYTPESFEIMGQKITIEYSNCIQKMGAVGMWIADEQRIIIATHDISGNEYSEEMMTQVYLHEKIHCILHFLSYHDLNGDEKFVDTFAHCLHQTNNTEK